MADFLDRILEHKRGEVAALPPVDAEHPDEPRGFADALAAPGLGVIAEIKRRSPSKGELAPNLDPAELARSYERGGARALSVLTDSEFFGGSNDDLRRARAATGLPVLRKDFIVDARQVDESVALGADAILLIVRALDDATLRSLYERARAHDLDVLVEVHDAAELDRALALDEATIGINNRDLATFHTDIDHGIALRERIPDGRVVVAESGISSAEQMGRLRRARFDAALIGESLVRAVDPVALLGEMIVPSIKICGITRERDLDAAVALGVEWVGFVFADSPRRIELDAAAELAATLPSGVRSVGVFMDADEQTIRRAIDAVWLDVVQLHGEEPAELCTAFEVPVWKRLKIDGELEREARRYEAEALLLDPGAGDGEPWDWQRCPRLPGRVVLAGGLRPDNVGEAIRAVRPWAVDVSSGVEQAPGIKSVTAMRDFVRAVRESDATIGA